eukprot:1045558-Prymnesium_polylepis.1
MAIPTLLALSLALAPPSRPTPRRAAARMTAVFGHTSEVPEILSPRSVDGSPLFEPPARLRHGQLLPRLTCARIPATDKLAMYFLLEYLQHHALNIEIFVSGGYVRDLLLGRTSQDLDLS